MVFLLLRDVVFVFFHTERFNGMKSTGSYYVVVVEDTDKNQVVAAATLILEQKFIHECALVS